MDPNSLPLAPPKLLRHYKIICISCEKIGYTTAKGVQICQQCEEKMKNSIPDVIKNK